MAKIAIVTDSTTYIPKELSKGHEIHVVPALIIWGDQEMYDGVDIQPKEFYERLAASTKSPTTSQPTPAAFKEKFEELGKKGFDVLGIFVSSAFSGTIASALQGKEMASGVKVEVIDGRSASMGTGWPLLRAAAAAKAGKSLAECVKIAEAARDNTGVMLMVDTLEFLHRGGRIGGAQRFLGTALNMKPILEVVEGKLQPVERVRTKGKAVKRMVELAEERIGGRGPVRIAVLHANAQADAEALLAEVKDRFKPLEAAITDVSPAVGTHTGPGTLGVAFLAGIE
ncbi:MAG: DegV family protein [Anaerolineales bacterium]|nr:DegV family protein [Anaerolineales bacterium]MCW5855890.1 DegV family protein [Anaerolineales bacterium]